MKHLRLLLIGLSLAIVSPAPAATRDELYTKAENDRTAKHYEDAITGYTELLRTEPRNGDLLVRRAVCYNSLKRYQEATLDYCRAHAAFLLVQSPKLNRAITLSNRADTCRLAGDLSAAFADGYSAKKVDDTYPRAYLVLAETWYSAGNLAMAQDFMAQAQKLDSSLARTFTAEGATRNGRDKIQPDDKVDTDADFNAAVAAYNEKDYAQAITLYDKILTVRPLNAGAWGNRGNALKSLGRPAEAIISQSHAAVLSGAMGGSNEATAQHMTNRLNCWLDFGDTEAALVDGEFATRIAPDVSRNWQRLAAAWYQWGDREKAESFAAEALKRDATFKGFQMSEEGARLNRAKRLARTGDRAALAELVEIAEKSRPSFLESNVARSSAISILDGLIATSPREVELLILRAKMENLSPSGATRIGSSEPALEWIDKAVALAPDNGEAVLFRGLLRLDFLGENKAREEGGYADLDHAIELGVESAEAYKRRAERAYENKNYAAALTDYTAALKLSPDDISLLQQRARVYESLKQWTDAITARDQVLAISPKKDSAYADRAETWLKAEDLTHAIADFSAAIALDNKNSDRYLGRARAYRLSGQPALARADHAKARALDTMLPELAADFSNADAIEGLRHDLQHAFKRMSKSIDALNTATVEVVKAEREKKRAEGRLQRLLVGDKRSPEEVLAEVSESEDLKVADAEDYLDRARAFVKLEKIDEALTALDQAIELEDKDAAARNMRGRIHESRKEYDEALADYDRAVELAPDDADYRRDRGDIAWARENFSEALSDYDKAVTLDEKNAGNWFKRANAKFKLTRFADAIADYDHALSLDPDLTNAKKNREIAQRRLAAE